MKMFFDTFKRSDSLAQTDRFAKTFAERAGAYREALTELIEKQDYPALSRFSFDYSLFGDDLSVVAARQCVALYQKCDYLPIDSDPERVAFEKFVDSELICQQSNRRIAKSRVEPIEARVAAVIHMAQRKITQILGDLPSFDELDLSYGPGANTNCRKTTSARWKLSAKPACSANLFSSVVNVLTQIPHYTSLHANSDSVESWYVDVDVEPGMLGFVPKNAWTDRSIIVEPSLNTLIQKGYGAAMKRRLLRAGVNLYDQTLNQRRARIGSLDGSLMTVDLSSASDTICKELVAELLPMDWYLALNECRTSHVVYRPKHGDWEYDFKLEKFSSMGNGFTFELESLIFYALTYAVCRYEGIRPDVSVYGDDIICPPEIWDSLLEVFTFCGFSINKEKSYRDGPFRESCGSDYFRGVNVRPYYHKQPWSYATLTAFHNFLKASHWDWIAPETMELILDAIPQNYRLYGPAGYGHGHLHSDRPILPHRREAGWAGYVFETFIKKPLRAYPAPIPGDRILPVYSVYIRASESEQFDPFVLRGERGEKRIRVYTLSRF